MSALRCRTCSHEEGLRGDRNQFDAAAEAVRRGWFVEWKHTEPFRNPFARLYCCAPCYVLRRARRAAA